MASQCGGCNTVARQGNGGKSPIDVAKFLQHDCVSSKTPGSSRSASANITASTAKCVYMRKHRRGSRHIRRPVARTQHAARIAGTRPKTP
jgi:hypothetical protein